MTVIDPPFPEAIDSSMRGAFVTCPRKYELQYLHNWATLKESVHLVAGGAFAKGLEVVRLAHFRDGLPLEEAIILGARALTIAYGNFECPSDSPKTYPNILLALYEYFDKYGLDTDRIQPFVTGGKPAVEFSFAIPLEVKHPTTRNPILYCGRFDMVGWYNKHLYVVDEKTTGQLGAQWRKSWKLRAQFTGYCWAAREYGHPVVGAIVRGMSILKNGYGHEEVLEPRADWEIERWYEQLHYDIERMISYWQRGHWDYNLDGGCTMYGGCAFLEPCGSSQPLRWLAQGFTKRIWNPMHKDED